MEVAHGGFEGLVAHGLLDGARVGAAFEAVGGVAVAQFVWENSKAEFSSGVFDGALDVGFVHSEADQGVGARVTADMVCGEQPGPCPEELEFGVLLC